VRDRELGVKGRYFVTSIDSSWSTDQANSVAIAQREEVDPDLILDSVGVV
jgi:hypothetical protein